METPGILAAVPQIRRWVTLILTGHYPDDAVYAAGLIATEHAANAVQHTRSGEDGGRIRVRLETGPDGIRVHVLDDGPPAAAAHDPDKAAHYNRGLAIVGGTATNCGHTITATGGRRTWAYIAAP